MNLSLGGHEGLGKGLTMKWFIFMFIFCLATQKTSKSLPLESVPDARQFFDQIFRNPTAEEKWLISGLPDAENFPNVGKSDLVEIHPDIFWRLPDRTVLDIAEYSGSVLADLIKQTYQDPSVIRKACSVLEKAKDSEKLSFLSNLAGLTKYSWKIVGEILSNEFWSF